MTDLHIFTHIVRYMTVGLLKRLKPLSMDNFPKI